MKIFLIIPVMLMCIFLISLVSASNPMYYNISINYDKGNIEIKDVSVIVSQYNVENFNEEGNYSVRILDFNNKKLEEDKFYIPNLVIEDYGENGTITYGQEIILNNVSFDLYIPYYSNAKEIVIYDSDKNEVATKDISSYSREKPESQIIGGDKDEHGCLISAGYSWCEEKQKCLRTWEEECTTNSGSGNVQKNNENIYNYIIIFLVVILIIVIAVYIILHFRDKKDKKHKK